MHRVEVVLCTFNGAEFLPAQLQSIRNQSRPIDRLVISDDGSTDGTLAILRSLEAPPRTVLHQNERRLGASANFGQALRQVNGDVVVLCDQDDIWYHNKVERLLFELDRHVEALLVHSDARIIDGTGVPSGKTLFAELSYSASDRTRWDRGEALAILVRQNVVTGATIAIRRDLLDYALPVPDGFWHDEWLALIAAAIGQIRRIDEPLIDYRIHDRNQIGLLKIRARERLRAMTSKRGDYHLKRAQKLEVLLQRVRALGSRVATEHLRLIEQVSLHWRDRAHLPSRRLARVPVIWRQWSSGGYQRFSSGFRSALRDLVETMP